MTPPVKPVPVLATFAKGFRFDSSDVAWARETNWYAQTPLVHLGSFDYTAYTVLRYEQAEALMADQRLSQFSTYVTYLRFFFTGPVARWWRGLMLNQNGLSHARLRRLTQAAIVPADIGRLRPAMRRIANDLVDKFGTSGECEFVSAFALPFPLAVWNEWLGIPEDQRPAFARSIATLGEMFVPQPGSHAAVGKALATASKIAAETIAARRRAPGDDLISRLISVDLDGDRLDDEELCTAVVGLPFADSSRYQLGLGLAAFVDHPHQLALLAERPELAHAAVEEVLRWVPAISGVSRIAWQSFDYEDLHVPWGTMLTIGIGAANRDRKVFGDAQFDIDAKRAKPPLTFGHGQHALSRLPGRPHRDGRGLRRPRRAAARRAAQRRARVDHDARPLRRTAAADPFRTEGRPITAPARTAQPTGTVTFLFTDIEGSTTRWDHAPGPMSDALRAHDEILRHAVENAGGRIFKTIGDAFCAVFARSDEAVAAALNAQHELAAGDFSGVGELRVRMAVHTGSCDERDGDFFGPPLNRTARLLAIGHGGQILLSGVAFELTRGALPAEATVLDLGSHRLKDLERAEHVYQIGAPDLPADFPPLRSEASRNENLPQSPASFVGRGADVELVSKLTRDFRLVTISGLGGVGKTRLAIEVARALHGTFPDGTWLVELAPVGEATLVSARVGAVFGMREQVGTAASDAWITALHDKEALLVLDNCEHVLDAAAAIVSKLLHACPRLRVLATSREPLRVQGEHLVRLAPLAVPADEPQLPSLEALRHSPAVQLFLERAERSSNFDESGLGDERARAALVTICRRLDGIPLALELAAARARTLGLPALAQRLDDRFRLLAGGDRSALPRQQTLRATLDWSFDLLDETERRVLERLSIFAGTFTLQAAQNVVADGAIGEWDVVDALASLVDKSLVSADPQDEVPRYSMLDTPRAYARERLDESGERASVGRRHLNYYQKRFEGSIRKPDAESDAPAQLEADLDNARAALDWAFGEGAEAVLGAAFVRTLSYVFEALSLYHEGLALLERAIAAFPAGGDKGLEAALLLAVAKFQSYIGSPKGSLEAAERAAVLYRELEKPKLLASALGFIAFASYYMDRRTEGLRLAEEGLAIARALGDPALLGWVLCVVAVCTDPAEADHRRELLHEALVCYRPLPGRYLTEMIYQFLSEVEFQAGDYALSRGYAQQGAADAMGRGPSEGLAMWCLTGAAAAAFALGDLDAAYHDAHEALSYGRRRGSGRFIGAALQLLAGIAAERGEGGVATRLLGASDAQFAALGRLRMPQEQFVYAHTRALLQANLSEAELTAALDEGRALAPEEAVVEAMRL